MRLQQPLYVQGKPVAAITVRVQSDDFPDDGRVEVTDVQLQAGEAASGVTFNPREQGTEAGGRTQYRNGVVHDGMEVVDLANPDRPTPTRMELRSHNGPAKIGTYRFTGSGGWVDGRGHSASNGWGLPPLITQRSDLYLRTTLEEGRGHLRLEWEDREP